MTKYATIATSLCRLEDLQFSGLARVPLLYPDLHRKLDLLQNSNRDHLRRYEILTLITSQVFIDSLIKFSTFIDSIFGQKQCCLLEDGSVAGLPIKYTESKDIIIPIRTYLMLSDFEALSKDGAVQSMVRMMYDLKDLFEKAGEIGDEKLEEIAGWESVLKEAHINVTALSMLHRLRVDLTDRNEFEEILSYLRTYITEKKQMSLKTNVVSWERLIRNFLQKCQEKMQGTELKKKCDRQNFGQLPNVLLSREEQP